MSEVVGYVFWIIGFLIQFVLWTLAIYWAIIAVYCVIELLLGFIGYKITLQKE